MGNILTAHVSVTGTRPIMWHAFGTWCIPLTPPEKTGVAGNDPEEWKRSVLATKDGQLYIRNDYVFGTLREAAKHTKSGRYTIQKKVQATLQVGPAIVLIDQFVPGWNGGPPEELTTDHDEPVYVDVRGVRNPNTKGRNIRYRVTARPGWKCEFELLWDATIVSREQMNAVAIDAGTLVGFADGRSIGMGRFTIDKFQIIN